MPSPICADDPIFWSEHFLSHLYHPLVVWIICCHFTVFKCKIGNVIFLYSMNSDVIDKLHKKSLIGKSKQIKVLKIVLLYKYYYYISMHWSFYALRTFGFFFTILSNDRFQCHCPCQVRSDPEPASSYPHTSPSSYVIYNFNFLHTPDSSSLYLSPQLSGPHLSRYGLSTWSSFPESCLSFCTVFLQFCLKPLNCLVNQSISP